MRIASWNINGIKARAGLVKEWLRTSAPDIVCLQEIKSPDEAFPHHLFDDLGYNIVTHGQKSYNGVAIFSKSPLEDVETGLPDLSGDPADDRQARYIEASVASGAGMLRIGCLYLPNGNPVDSDKFDYKLVWMERLAAHMRRRMALEEPFVLLGDFNVIPGPEDARSPENWDGDALFDRRTLSRYRQLVNLGLTDAIRAVSDSPDLFTFWDFQGGAFRRDEGIRIDHILLSPQAASLLQSAGIDRDMRAEERPSDHVPVFCTLSPVPQLCGFPTGKP